MDFERPTTNVNYLDTDPDPFEGGTHPPEINNKHYICTKFSL